MYFQRTKHNMCVLQLTTVLANVIGRYKVALAPQMGGWAGCREREINAFTLMVIGERPCPVAL